MSFFYSETGRKLPLRGRNRLPMRSKRHRRLQLLREFQPGRIYTFCPHRELDDVPDELLLWQYDDEPDDDVSENDGPDETLDDEYDGESLYGHA